MIKPIMRFSTLTLVVSLTLAGCGVFGGGTVSPNAWELGAISPDGTQLLVGTFFGADTSCSRFEGWEVNETDEWVEILAMLWNKDGPDDCNLAGMSSQVVAQLDKPLGARGIVGCGADECMAAPALSGRFRGPPVAVANDGHVAVIDDEELRLFDSEGTLLSTELAVSRGRFEPVGDLLVSTSGASIAAYDVVQSETRWTLQGQMLASDDDFVYTCTEDQVRGTVAQIEADTGDSQWTMDTPCDFVVPLDDTVIMLGTIPTAPGELVVADRMTGTEITRRPFDDGTDNRVNGARGATRVGEHVVVFGWESDTIVLDGMGEEVTRRPDHLGVPVGATNTVLITALQQELLGTDPLTGEVIWTLDRRHAGGQSNSFIIVDDTLWLPDPGVVTRFDASTGNAEWSTPVPLGAGMSLAVDADAVYVTSPLSLTALDRETGVELWSAALPWSGETVTAVSAEN